MRRPPQRRRAGPPVPPFARKGCIVDKKLAGLVGVMGALAVASPGHAAPTLDDAMRAETYADLLRPIPNAQALLAKSNAAELEANAPELIQVQYYYHHHHHHHHHQYERPYYPVQRGYYPGERGYYSDERSYYRPRYHHHHHHHHHHNQQRGFGIFIR